MVVRTVACELLAELSWLVWDAEDSLEFYPAQASQSFFSLPRSLRPRNRESSQQRQGAHWAEETGCPSGSLWSVGGDRENWVLGVGQGSGSRVVTVGIRAWSWLRVGAVRLGSWLSGRMSPRCPRRGRSRRRSRQTSQWHSLRVHRQQQPRQQQQEYHPQPQQYADWFPMAEQFFRAMYQGAWQPGQAVAGGQFPVPPPAVPEQQEVEPEVEQPVRQQRSGTGSTRSGQRRAAVSEARTALLERFLRLRPPMFHGEYDPDKAESWTHELERIFETMECAEEDQVRLAVYQLKGAAHEWWRVQRQTHFQGQRLDQISWQQFSEVFHGEYFPDYSRRERRDQLHELVQGDLTVSQYHQRFVRLLRHVPHVAGSDQACAERFIAGLRPDLSSGSCLLAGVDGAVSRGVSPGHFRRDCPRGQAPQQQQPVQYAQQPPQYQYPPQQQAPHQQQRGQYQQQVQQFPQPQQYQSYQQQQQQFPQHQQPPQQQPQQAPQQQPQQAPQHGRGRGRVMALTREQAEASNLVIDDIPTVAFWFDGWRHGVCRLLEGDMAYVAFPSCRPRRRLTDVTGVLCVSTALAVSAGSRRYGRRDQGRDGGCVAFGGPVRRGACRLFWDAGLSPGARAPFPLSPFFFPFFLSLPLRALLGGRGAFSMVVAAVLRWASFRCAGVVFVPCGARRRRFYLREGPVGRVLHLEVDSGAEGKTVVRTVACQSLAELSWLVWDAEDSLEFYPTQASQSFFSLPRSLRPRNRESSQKRQGARRAKETGR
ncbi:hypothetical protein Taro_014512 [Colocasia esculenta]|uniref:Retrotransposon gag domain-containing protein n=1 Tax=Colocasia esculenta TaxID=4460 RepID=A0A843UER7_COLES|nr:hypothetical protein [Colocasia esculenta]